MPHQKDDVVRIVNAGRQVSPMIAPYVGSEAIVLEVGEQPGMYVVEIDTGRGVDRGGQIGPRFVVTEKMVVPEVTTAMIEAADKAFRDYEGSLPAGSSGVLHMTEALATSIYRAMRRARFER